VDQGLAIDAGLSVDQGLAQHARVS